ncbi:MFS-type transporter SLC18B1-like isoform X2 [Chrysoperla carnea]|nr:MFS-type transporter SLC18B1-like isoform X2 [Chrysoperla carnea]
MEASERISPDKVMFSDSPPHSGKHSNDDSTLSVSWSDHRSRYNRSQSVTDVDHDEYSPAEIRRIRERLVRQHAPPQPSQLRLFTRKQKLTLTSLALVDFMSFCSMSIMAPFFPREASQKGMNDLTSGFVFSFYAFIMFISSPVFGKILPRVGAKVLFMSGMFLAGICNLIFGLLEFIDNYDLFATCCFVIRGMEALGASAYSTASYVFVVNTFPNSIGSVLGILETFVGLGMSTGPAIGGLLYSLGGFGLPFYVLGILMVAVVPINFYLLPSADECNMGSKTSSIFDLLKLPSVLVTGFVVIIVSNTWGFLDPTLEPHLRGLHLSPEKIGLIFLLFSALYGISSPAWGWLADKCNNHWSMMVIGLLLCTSGLLLLGPSPYLSPFLDRSIWLDLIGLSILGISVALTLLPTFQRVLSSAVEGGFPDSLSTCSLVAGLWSCMYALGEVLGPALGGILLEHVGFPMAATIQALMSFTLAILTLLYFTLKSVFTKRDNSSDSGISGSWKSSLSDDEMMNEKQPLLSGVKKGQTESLIYTNEKEIYNNMRSLYYGQESDEVTDVRKMMSITAGGACEL